jgi:hypothetical protein
MVILILFTSLLDPPAPLLLSSGLILPSIPADPGPPRPFEVARTAWSTVAVFLVLPVVVGNVSIGS